MALEYVYCKLILWGIHSPLVWLILVTVVLIGNKCTLLLDTDHHYKYVIKLGKLEKTFGILDRNYIIPNLNSQTVALLYGMYLNTHLKLPWAINFTASWVVSEAEIFLLKHSYTSAWTTPREKLPVSVHSCVAIMGYRLSHARSSCHSLILVISPAKEDVLCQDFKDLEVSYPIGNNILHKLYCKLHLESINLVTFVTLC